MLQRFYININDTPNIFEKFFGHNFDVYFLVIGAISITNNCMRYEHENKQCKNMAVTFYTYFN